MVLKTERLLLRRMELSDADGYYRVFGDPSVALYDEFDPIDAGQARSDVERAVAAYEDPDSEEFEYAVQDADGQVVGVLYCNLANAGMARIGYHFAVVYQRRGYATEAVRAFCLWLAEHRGRERIAALVDSANVASLSVLRRCGFEAIGEARVVFCKGCSRLEWEYSLHVPSPVHEM